jgi:hypothetical protein
MIAAVVIVGTTARCARRSQGKRVCRRSKCKHRISLGGGTVRAPADNGRRIVGYRSSAAIGGLGRRSPAAKAATATQIVEPNLP